MQTNFNGEFCDELEKCSVFMLTMRFPGKFTFAENSLETRHIHGIARVHWSVSIGNPGYFGRLEDYSSILEDTKFKSPRFTLDATRSQSCES